ncbi:MAG: ABC transporter ATP-binding protein [Longimicrobiales bacterium]|nr:ABC transporter ATP-binding protein [Longimicrobiales bacterium]
MTETVLELHDVAVTYDGSAVLDVPHLAVRRGEVLTLLGENGSGKTTLLRLLGLLVRPARGRVVFGGEEVDFGKAGQLLELRRRTAAVMQEPLLCRMSVRRNVELGLRFRRLPKSEAKKRVDLWLERLSISHLRERPASKLSGGEARRASLARAMVLDPEVLFLDEPFTALDAPTRQSQLQEFQAVLAESGVTTVFATHDRGEALGLGGSVAVMMRGRVAQAGSAEAVFSRPEQVEVARFVGIETLIPGRVTGRANGLVQVACGGIHLEAEGDREAGEDVYVAVRPEDIDLYDQGIPTVGGGGNVLSGQVTKTVPAETHYRVEVDCGVRVVAVVSRASFRQMSLEVGRRVQATFPARAAHLIRRAGD